MTKLVVMYPKPKDPAHFDKHFRDVHMPLVKKMPGLESFSFGPASGPDGGEGAFFWLFIGTFASAAAIGEALGSPAGQQVVADIPNYAPPGFDPTIVFLDSTEG